MKKMKYIVTYGPIEQSDDKRYYAASVRNKVEYMILALNNCGITLEIISCCRSKKRWGRIRGKKESLEQNEIINAPLICLPTSIGWKIQSIFVMIWLFLYLIINTNKNEQILIYHDLSYWPFISMAQKIKGFKICLEVEEIFTNMISQSANICIREEYKLRETCIFKRSDKFIVASETIYRQIGQCNKEYCIFNGNLLLPKLVMKPFDDGKIHIVYAGCIKYNLVAFTGIRIAKYLPNKYALHVIGWGEHQDIDFLVNEINDINRASECKISYDGMQKGSELNEYLQKCHIGISPQRDDPSFANSCFPSKIAVYLSNGLRVVASKSNSVSESPLGELIVFSSDSTPEEFAQTIQKVDLNDPYDPRAKIKEMDETFRMELEMLLK